MNEEEVYKPLKEATPKELLEAAIWFWSHVADDRSDYIAGMREGFALLQINGWQHVAPAWLREVGGEICN